ncbi:hypothetical protein BGX27_001364 [Mortierella sp. AM989]|nr:hypothetical protein BGX27_001364 [Mortierella sp. AM989]
MDNLDSADILDDNKEGKEEEEGVDEDQLFNIAYSLPSGLAILSPLKQLRSLILTGVHHDVGLDEIQWMCQHWPTLNRIEGLYWNEDWDEDKLVLHGTRRQKVIEEVNQIIFDELVLSVENFNSEPDISALETAVHLTKYQKSARCLYPSPTTVRPSSVVYRDQRLLELSPVEFKGSPE